MAIHIEHPTSDEQVAAWAGIMLRLDDIRIGVDSLRHGFEEDRDSLWALGYLDGVPVGVGVSRPSSRLGANYGMARVLPEHRGRGLGTALLTAISAHTHAGGRHEVWGRIFADDTQSLAFAERRGFREVGREREVVLDVAGAAQTKLEPPSGIELVSFAERPDLIPAVFEKEAELAADVPGHSPHQEMTYEHWARENVEGPGVFLEACFVALDAGEVVGYTSIRRRGADAPDAENLLTAVRRPWRGRGIATALKRAQIERARAAGVEKIYTSNDEVNTAMRGVNERLGYEPLPERVIVSGAA